MNWLELFKVFPVIIVMVADLAKTFEVPGVPGTTKKQAVMDVLKASLDGLGKCGIQSPITVILTVADYAIDALVAGFNIIGVFKKKEAQA